MLITVPIYLPFQLIIRTNNDDNINDALCHNLACVWLKFCCAGTPAYAKPTHTIVAFKTAHLQAYLFFNQATQSLRHSRLTACFHKSLLHDTPGPCFTTDM